MAITEAPGTDLPDIVELARAEAPPVPVFRPFIPPEVVLPELTVLPLVAGTVLGVVFGASSLYLVLKVGLTVSASIPVAVISIALFRLLSAFGLRRRSILENNIVQTAGSAGESIAFGIGVTMPAIMILGLSRPARQRRSWPRRSPPARPLPLRRRCPIRGHGRSSPASPSACSTRP